MCSIKRGGISCWQRRSKNETLEQIEDLEWQYKKYSSNKNLPAEIRKDILTKVRQALKGLELKRSQEQLAINNSQTRYNDLLEPPDPVDVQVAEAELAVLPKLCSAMLKENWNAPSEVRRRVNWHLLEAQIEKGHVETLRPYRAGPDPEDVALAEARITNAEAQLAAAQAAIEDRELLAPFDGVISALHVNPGEWVTPGSPVLLIGNLDQMQVETTDLGEIDVAQILVGDPAMVTFDSLPELALQGTVSRIAPMSTEGAGVNYPVIIALDEIPAALRWGMTAFVDIEHN